MQAGEKRTDRVAPPNPDPATVVHRWFEEVWNQGNLATIDELFSSEGVIWGVGRPEAASRGPAEFKVFHAALRGACPDIHITIEQIVQEQDTAFARWTVTMTHTGDGLGLAPTNAKMKLCGMSALRMREGKIVEGWNVWDQIGMARELGLLEGNAKGLFG